MIRTLATFWLLAVLAIPSPGKSKPPAPPVDPDYIYALGTANHFLHAWQTQDQETAILLLSDRLKQSTADIALDGFLTCKGSKPQSFEIGRGKKLATGRYRFPIALFQNPANSTSKRLHPQSSALVVLKTGKNEWAIDQLP